MGWCAIPFPQYALPDRGSQGDVSTHGSSSGSATLPLSLDDDTPGHGAARVRVNFWFFLFVYYGFYNLTALIWITKVFNLYSLNWYVPPTLFLLLLFFLHSCLCAYLP